MNKNKSSILFVLLLGFVNLQAQKNDSNPKSDLDPIRETLHNYIEGTINGESERLKKHFTLNLICVQFQKIPCGHA